MKARKVNPVIWNSNAVSQGAKLLYVFMATHPLMDNTGCLRLAPCAISFELGDPENFDVNFRELLAAGWIACERGRPLVHLPGFLADNPPESPNAVKSWRKDWERLPACELARNAFLQAKRFVAALPHAFLAAFVDAFADCPEICRPVTLNAQATLPLRPEAAIASREASGPADGLPQGYCEGMAQGFGQHKDKIKNINIINREMERGIAPRDASCAASGMSAGRRTENASHEAAGIAGQGGATPAAIDGPPADVGASAAYDGLTEPPRGRLENGKACADCACDSPLTANGCGLMAGEKEAASREACHRGGQQSAPPADLRAIVAGDCASGICGAVKQAQNPTALKEAGICIENRHAASREAPPAAPDGRGLRIMAGDGLYLLEGERLAEWQKLYHELDVYAVLRRVALFLETHQRKRPSLERVDRYLVECLHKEAEKLKREAAGARGGNQGPVCVGHEAGGRRDDASGRGGSRRRTDGGAARAAFEFMREVLSAMEAKSGKKETCGRGERAFGQVAAAAGEADFVLAAQNGRVLLSAADSGRG